MTRLDTTFARDVWRSIEAIHAVVYFDPETKAAYADAGLKGYWMGYFASRSAAMGPVPPEVVIATFYNFHPRMVRRAIPDAWSFSSPESVLAARGQVVDVALTRCWGDWATGADAAELASLLEELADRSRPEGRPLFAAHAGLDRPREMQRSLWHSCTLLREYRGDGHVAALTAAGIDGIEAHVTAVAAGTGVREVIQPHRGWSDEEWSKAEGRLRARELLDDDGALTHIGAELRASVERRTDELALLPWVELGAEKGLRIRELLRAPVRLILDDGVLPFPNPMGLSPTDG